MVHGQNEEVEIEAAGSWMAADGSEGQIHAKVPGLPYSVRLKQDKKLGWRLCGRNGEIIADQELVEKLAGDILAAWAVRTRPA